MEEPAHIRNCSRRNEDKKEWAKGESVAGGGTKLVEKLFSNEEWNRWRGAKHIRIELVRLRGARGGGGGGSGGGTKPNEPFEYQKVAADQRAAGRIRKGVFLLLLLLLLFFLRGSGKKMRKTRNKKPSEKDSRLKEREREREKDKDEQKWPEKER